MEVFEIHITGDERIIKAAKALDLKTIVIDLLRPDKSYYRTEYMTSQAYHCENFNKCQEYVNDLVNKLNVDILRVKIECPYYRHYVDQSLYFEVHYKAKGDFFPMSQNKGKNYFLCTAREYDKTKYDSLWQKHGGIFLLAPPENFIMELCLYDTNINEDKDWFDLYEQRA